MKQVMQVLSNGAISVVDVPPPALRPGGVLVQTAYSVISAGTERAKVEVGRMNLFAKARSRPDQMHQVLAKMRSEGLLQTYRTVRNRLETPSPLGYSCSGVVMAAGVAVEGLGPGDRVACGGGGYANHAEIVYVPQNLCVLVPSNIDLEDAAYATLGAVAMQGFRQAEAALGDSVAIIGLGLIGQLAAQVARAAGCRVFGIDPDAARVTLARGLGVHEAVSPSERSLLDQAAHFTGGRGFDAVLITAATPSSDPVVLAGQIARDRGVVVVVGDVGMDVPRNPFYEKELTLRLSRSYGPGRYDSLYEDYGLEYPIGFVPWTERRNIEEFVRLLGEGRVSTKALTTHRIPVEEASRAYEVVAGTTGERGLGVLLEYSGKQDSARPVMIARSVRGPKRTGTTLGIGLVGAGHFATSALLPALVNDPRVDLRGVVTSSGLTAHHVAQSYGFRYASDDIEHLLADDEIGCIIIATRHTTHAGLAQRALQAGKAVYVEKPLATDLDGLRAVVGALDSSAGYLTVGFNRRFAPHTARIKEALEGRVAPIAVLYRVNAGALPFDHWTQTLEEGGGRIIGELCHFVDLAAFLAGSRPSRVFAEAVRTGRPAALQDQVVVTVRFEDGSVATIAYLANGNSALPKEYVEVYSDGRVFALDDFRHLSIAQGTKLVRSSLRRQDKGHAVEMKSLVDFGLGAQNAMPSAQDCVDVTLATFAVVESLASALPVNQELLSAALFSTNESSSNPGVTAV